jgi:hypothetical protein
MSYSAPLELLTDATGSVTFGWMEEGVYYARFSHCLSARLGEAFAARLRSAVQSSRGPMKYFADGRALESYDLLARSAVVRVVTEHRRRFVGITLLAWDGGEVDHAMVTALGEPIEVTKDTIDFEASLFATAPRARYKLGAKTDARSRSRWPLRR